MVSESYLAHKVKRDYLVGKLVDGSRAMRDFFEKMAEKESVNPQAVAEEIAVKYNLTDNQRKYLEDIAFRTEFEVKMSVEYAKTEYGTTPRGLIKDKNGLFREAFNKEPPKCYFSAKPTPIGIEFSFPPEYFAKNVGGDYAWNYYTIPNGIYLDSYTGIPKYRISRLKRKSKQQKLLEAVFGFSMDKQALESRETHERKHLIDDLTDSKLLLKELSAGLYERNNPKLVNLNREVERDVSKLEMSLKCLSEIAQIHINKETAQKQMNETPLDVFGKLYEKGIDGKTSSYIVSTTPLPKLKRRLELVAEHLGCD